LSVKPYTAGRPWQPGGNIPTLYRAWIRTLLAKGYVVLAFLKARLD
jgi:hypothetical protein